MCYELVLNVLNTRLLENLKESMHLIQVVGVNMRSMMSQMSKLILLITQRLSIELVLDGTQGILGQFN